MNHGLYPGFTLPKKKGTSTADSPPPSQNPASLDAMAQAEYEATNGVKYGIHRWFIAGGAGAQLSPRGEFPDGSGGNSNGQQAGTPSDTNATLRYSRAIPTTNTPLYYTITSNAQPCMFRNRYFPAGFYHLADMFDYPSGGSTQASAKGFFFGMAGNYIYGSDILTGGPAAQFGLYAAPNESTLKIRYRVLGGSDPPTILTTTPFSMTDLYLKMHRFVIYSTEIDKCNFEIWTINPVTAEMDQWVWGTQVDVGNLGFYTGNTNKFGPVMTAWCDSSSNGPYYYLHKGAGWYRY